MRYYWPRKPIFPNRRDVRFYVEAGYVADDYFEITDE